MCHPITRADLLPHYPVWTVADAGAVAGAEAEAGAGAGAVAGADAGAEADAGAGAGADAGADAEAGAGAGAAYTGRGKTSPSAASFRRKPSGVLSVWMKRPSGRS